MADEIKTADEARELPDGTWVIDADEHPWCMLDTHTGFPQRMAGYKRSLTNLDNIAYPLSLADFDGDCDHRWGTHEMGQCIRCGVRVAEPRPTFFDAQTMDVVRFAAEANARHESTVSSSGRNDDESKLDAILADTDEGNEQ